MTREPLNIKLETHNEFYTFFRSQNVHRSLRESHIPNSARVCHKSRLAPCERMRMFSSDMSSFVYRSFAFEIAVPVDSWWEGEIVSIFNKLMNCFLLFKTASDNESLPSTHVGCCIAWNSSSKRISRNHCDNIYQQWIAITPSFLFNQSMSVICLFER